MEGRPIYKLSDGERFLLVPEGGGVWAFVKKVHGPADIVAGRGTDFPGQEEAGPSTRYGTTGWRYLDKITKAPGYHFQDSVDEITVTCQ
jgi:hypothetical protein